MKEELNRKGAQNVFEMIMAFIFNLPSICQSLELTLPDEYDKGKRGGLIGINFNKSQKGIEDRTLILSFALEEAIDEDFGSKWRKHSYYMITKIRFLITNPTHLSSYMIKIIDNENIVGGITLPNGWVIATSTEIKQINELISVLWQHYYVQNTLESRLAYTKTLWEFGIKKRFVIGTIHGRDH